MRRLRRLNAITALGAAVPAAAPANSPAANDLAGVCAYTPKHIGDKMCQAKLS
jgi:hypothetical protein